MAWPFYLTECRESWPADLITNITDIPEVRMIFWSVDLTMIFNEFVRDKRLLGLVDFQY